MASLGATGCGQLKSYMLMLLKGQLRSSLENTPAAHWVQGRSWARRRPGGQLHFLVWVKEGSPTMSLQAAN